ncbi:MAG: helix-turn-helix domain-containing protein [Oscillospiraceae bacterium]
MNLKELRLKNNLTQEKLANELSISRSAYTRYENGERNLSISLIKKISDFYNISIDALLDNDTDGFYSKIYGLSNEERQSVSRYIEYIRKRQQHQ